MSWERYHFFFLIDHPTISPEKEEFIAFYDLMSQSNYFGYFLKDLFDYFNDFSKLRFLIPQDICFDSDYFAENADIFDLTQQKIVIAEIDRFLSQLSLISIDILAQYHIFNEKELGENETLSSLIQQSTTLHYDDFDIHNLGYFTHYLAALQFIKQFFQQAIDQNLYLIYKTTET